MDMASAELKGCPYCRKLPRVEKLFTIKPKRTNEIDMRYPFGFNKLEDFITIYFVICEKCGLSTLNCNSKEQAIEEWNKIKN